MDRLNAVFTDKNDLKTAKEDLQFDKMRLTRDKVGKTALGRISVQDAIKILQDKRANLFNEKSKQFSLELERMIMNMDENELVAYLREELQKKE